MHPTIARLLAHPPPPAPEHLDGDWLREVALAAGADNVTVLAVDHLDIVSELPFARAALPSVPTLVPFVVRTARAPVRSPARSVSNGALVLARPAQPGVARRHRAHAHRRRPLGARPLPTLLPHPPLNRSPGARTRLPASLLGPPPRPLRPPGRRHRCLVRHRSGARFQGAPFAAGCAATKSFVQSLGEGLAVELATDNIDVLALAPGPAHTGFAARPGLKMGMALGVAEVADAAVAAIGARGTSFPGWLAKLLRTLTGTVPRWVATRIFGKMMADMAA